MIKRIKIRWKTIAIIEQIIYPNPFINNLYKISKKIGKLSV